MPLSGTCERVTPVLDFPSRDGLSVQAIRVDYEPGGFTGATRRHPAGAYVYVIDGGVEVVVGDGGGRGGGRAGGGWGGGGGGGGADRVEGRRVVLRAAGRAALGVAQCQ